MQWACFGKRHELGNDYHRGYRQLVSAWRYPHCFSPEMAHVMPGRVVKRLSARNNLSGVAVGSISPSCTGTQGVFFVSSGKFPRASFRTESRPTFWTRGRESIPRDASFSTQDYWSLYWQLAISRQTCIAKSVPVTSFGTGIGTESFLCVAVRTQQPCLCGLPRCYWGYRYQESIMQLLYVPTCVLQGARHKRLSA